ncbi:hypothetical protein HanXRQr2_Chr16g0776611 [Helianthus annuus]|uniref:DUF4283 domain-containing protein n=1 Tax=Helianthus annuus TaxID=4232 RepID=A0A9K3H0C3_HELAN|nr:hypothetical protein HanXRQr2_Chr16g0776611 [Helianthus annuus]KAJ0445465.1 hypothetical protein HanIR_Chr16g0843231 [Helianthus annuus]KAJ0462544.1 hypothetical protein HanHA89_Chr16g0684531 [Helianthus annuus]KAJ0642942.1 hypothetical protein HanLR1_Chr16g0643941 [Helianthus annuus]KAJ0646806.1 hypothetical protein HanOQP8_Chr16g0639231 [Helianthus annuus]
MCLRVSGITWGLILLGSLIDLVKKFGFLSFRNVRDVKRLEADMLDVWLGSYKLFVVRARFVDGVRMEGDTEVNKSKNKEGATSSKAAMEPPHEVHANPNMGGMASCGGNNGRSYRDMFLNKNNADTQQTVLKIDDNIEGFKDWHKVTLCARVKDFNMLSSLNSLLKKNWDSMVEIKYGGGFNVMLVFVTEEDCNSFMEKKDLWVDWFEIVEKWVGQMFKFERITWLKIYGIPICLALDQVYEAVGNRYGVVIQPASVSNDDKDLSYGYIGVLCSRQSRVDDRLTISWRGTSIKVWVNEDVREWVPD